MTGKQTEADKAAALKEYNDRQNAAVDRMALLRAARLAREAGQPIPSLDEPAVKKPKKKKKNR